MDAKIFDACHTVGIFFMKIHKRIFRRISVWAFDIVFKNEDIVLHILFAASNPWKRMIG